MEGQVCCLVTRDTSTPIKISTWVRLTSGKSPCIATLALSAHVLYFFHIFAEARLAFDQGAHGRWIFTIIMKKGPCDGPPCDEASSRYLDSEVGARSGTWYDRTRNTAKMQQERSCVSRWMPPPLLWLVTLLGWRLRSEDEGGKILPCLICSRCRAMSVLSCKVASCPGEQDKVWPPPILQCGKLRHGQATSCSDGYSYFRELLINLPSG
ncbi:hypothetical protein TREES_T100021669 [Tupaia chinensis]|uniref:Uncharacterized protein n=1 Tax=Tupaia chinensis TaxID=246437 RepID=L9JMF2_TUPCH|nr:hypothetical protein TREES_T100021669 [Tupaia chinensis]